MGIFRGSGGAVMEMDTPKQTQALERFVGKIVGGELTLLVDGTDVPAQEALAVLFPADDGQADVARPPVKGKGSGLAAWQAYAEQLGLEVGGLDRDAIVALVDGGPADDGQADVEPDEDDDEDQDDDEDGSYVFDDA